MMEIKRFVFNPVGVNCYVVSDSESREGAVIDCGAFSPDEFSQMEQYIDDKGITLRHALQTHMHFDHVFGLDLLCDRYGIKPECHPAEVSIYHGNPQLAMQLCGVSLPLPKVEVGNFLSDGQTISIGSLTLTVVHTPGHTPGGLCFHFPAEGVLFSGDTLFRGSIGRTDTPQGSWRTELESVRTRLLTLPPDTTVHPGHGPSTTIQWEMTNNPYISTFSSPLQTS